MFLADKWKDYEILYAGKGEKYERWGNVKLLRPDPQAVWPVIDGGKVIQMKDLPSPNAVYNRSSEGGGSWTRLSQMPSSWKISYDSLGRELTFIVEPTSFKHTGLFPEQAVNWDFCGGRIIYRCSNACLRGSRSYGSRSHRRFQGHDRPRKGERFRKRPYGKIHPFYR